MSNIEASRKYALEIYQPDGDGYLTVCSMESDVPFMAIHKGDYLNPSTWNLYCVDNLESEYKESRYGTVLEVMGVEHALAQKENGAVTQHKLMIFAEPVENNHTILYGKSE